MVRAIDKLQKKGPDQVLAEYKEKVDGKKLSLLIELSNEKGTPDEVAAGSSELVKLKTWSRVSALMDSLRARGIRNAILDLGIVRGLDYYSGCVFEVFDSAGGAALVGGGRYDSLTEAFGKKDIGATGAAGGVERIISALNVHGLLTALVTKIVYVVSASDDSMNDVRRIVSNLRKEGIPTAYDVIGRSLKKQLEDAASRGAAICVIAFHDETTQGFVTVRSMSDGKETKYQLERLAEAVRKYL